ncbi:hypothetical protein AB0M28_08095 [Streptomyces sp. NPDC051940]|uniref:hypothetical protein n=1 Tax=Streptomyces sp. NPDC051940 TaxID=3155675 RepID=UPI003435F35A
MENLSAGQKLTRAFDKVGEQTSLHLTLGLDATPAELIALSKDDKDPLDAKTARFVSGMEISYDVTSKKAIGKTGEKDVTGQRIALSGPDGELLELRIIGKDALYARADLQQFADLTGEKMPSAAEIPPEAGALGDFFEGDWIKLDLAKLEKFSKEMEKQGAAAGAVPGLGTPSLSPETGKKLFKDLKKAFAGEVTLKNKGEVDGLDQVTATANARSLVDVLFDAVSPYAKDLGMPGEFPKPTAKDLKDIPNKRVAVDFFLKDGALDSASVNLGVLTAEKDDDLGLKAEFGEADAVEAPSGAAELDIEQIAQAMMGSKGAGLDY